jgi:4-amino-4-deoxy-L-arabinose transferase-like glycosyltransferase
MNSPAQGEEPNRRLLPRIPRGVWLCMLAVCLIAQQAMLWWLYYQGGAKQLVGDEVRYWNTAHDILAGGPWHPSDLWPPAQPLFIASVLTLGGDSVLAVQIVQTLLFFGCALLVRDLWKRISGNSLAATIAAVLFVLAPSNAAYAHYLWPEATHLFVLLLALDLLLARAAGNVSAVAAGVCIGLALSFKSLLTGYWPLLFLCFVRRWWPVQVNWRPAALFAVALALTVTPAVLAGHRNTGHWAIADSSVINLLLGLGVPQRNDYISLGEWHPWEDYMSNGRTPDERNAWAWRQVDEKLQSEGVATVLWQQLGKQYFRLFESKTLLLTQLPGPACAGYLGAYRETPRWAALVVRWSSHLFHALILAGFAFGVCMQRNWRRVALWLLLALVGYQLAIYLGLLAISRYLLPITAIFCGFAGDALALAYAAHPNTTTSRTRLLAGALLASLLLVLAFAGPWIDGYCRT